MKRIILMLTVAAMLVVAMTVTAAPAFAALDEGNGRGNPTTTPSGKCPPGQNQDLSPGGQKKCTR
jgi:hypothetical protein